MDAVQVSSTPEPDTLLHDDPFRNENTQRLFEAIDELRSCGANHEIGLPELVIVGDQSAGKSSLLQSLTDIPFPVADRLCTRFPTRIVSRRTPNQAPTTRISIEPNTFDWTGPSLSGDQLANRAKRLEAYNKFEHTSSHVSSESFKDVVEKAKELMDIKRTTSTEEGSKTVGDRNFASDVLKVEISGPDRSYFSILDVPGVFQSLTKDLTNQEKDGVRSMVASYMKPTHSVIICVASGTNDLANQATFDMASHHDPQLERTIGVITKCDITQDKDQILALAQNEEKHLNHGWFVVRNRTPSELTSNITAAERHSRERAFFDGKPWTRLAENRRGTQALKRYLADLLCSRIQETFPTILSTIQGRQAMATAQLDKLGLARDTTEEKRVYLTELAQQLHGLASQAVRGRYHGLSNESLKLRRFVREANDTFASEMIHNGYSVPFHTASVAIPEKDHSGLGKSAGTSFGGLGGFGSTTTGNQAQSSSSNAAGGSSPFRSRTPPPANNASKPASGSFFGSSGTKPQTGSLFPQPANGSNSFGSQAHIPAPNPSGGLFSQTPLPISQSSLFATLTNPASTSSIFSTLQPSKIYAWIREEIKNCRGTELQGTLNPDVLPALFHRQAVNWKGLASTHFQTVAQITASVLEQATRTACGDKLTAGNIHKLFQHTNKICENRSLAQIHQRFDEIVTRHLQTQNPIFEQNIRDARLARFTAALERYRSRKAPVDFNPPSSQDPQQAAPTQISIDLRDVTSLFDELHMSNAQNLEDDIHDTLKSYYELALHDFIEFVTQQVVESYLNDPKGPVLFFNPTYIGGLGPRDIDDLGAEDPGVVKQRGELMGKLERLGRAEGIALKYS